MDFSWMPYLGTFWIFPLLCLLVMAVMMIGCGRMMFRGGHCGRGAKGRDPLSRLSDGTEQLSRPE